MFKTSRFSFMVLMPFLFLCYSCSDDFDPQTELNGTKSDIMTMLQSEDITQRASIDSDDFTFISSKGTRVKADVNSFVFSDSGILATGMIDFEMTELFTKSEILQYGIVTESLNSILESDGEFLFNASQNGQPLQLANGKELELLVFNSNPNSDMQLFMEGEGAWWPSQDSLNIFAFNSFEEFSGYQFSVSNFNWVNIDYFSKFDLELTDISICLPEGYQNDRITLWIVFKDRDIVLNSSGENLPVGEVVSIICIAAEDEDNFRIDIQEVTIAEGLKINLSPKSESEENIKKLLKELD